jgi:hypothetical protein
MEKKSFSEIKFKTKLVEKINTLIDINDINLIKESTHKG